MFNFLPKYVESSETTRAHDITNSAPFQLVVANLK